MLKAYTGDAARLEQRFEFDAAASPHNSSYSFGFLCVKERERIARHIQKGCSLGLLLFEVENYFVFQKLYGQEIASAILTVLEKELRTQLPKYLNEIPLLYIERVESGNIILMCGNLQCDQRWLRNAAFSMRLGLRSDVKREVIKLTGQELDIAAGYALLPKTPLDAMEQSVYAAMCDAQRIARGGYSCNASPELIQEFRDIVDTPLLGVHYQPIVDLRTGDIHAWEALARGPASGNFRSPAVLFDFAEEMEAVFSLEKVCRETAIRDFGPAQGKKLFLNVHPKTMMDPAFTPGETKKLLSRYGLEPSDVVLEITERHSTRDFTLFHRTLAHYRNEGYKVAIDDVGAGYSGLWSIAEIRPDFMKLDMALTRGIDANPVKRALIETLLTFAEKVGCKIIAEGIETENELSGLVRMGLHYGQGFHLHRPAYPRPAIAQETARGIVRSGNRISAEIKCSVPIMSLMQQAATTETTDLVAQIKKIFEQDESVTAMPVVRDARPVGLVMRHNLDRMLSTQYGLALYQNKRVTRIMDPSPLVVEGFTPVETVAQAAMSRDPFKIYDPILVTRDGQLVGMASVHKILDTLACVQVEMAKGANPLTGLPGNVAIEREIERRCGQDAHACFVYADLDNFKVYNDTYGFKEGDDILLLTGRVLAWATRRHGGPNGFTGHVGGDDFVLAVEPDRAERVCQAIVRCFKRLIRQYYDETDRERGFIVGKDRQGVERAFGFISISLGIVDAYANDTIHTVAQRAADLKKYAKSHDGNIWVRDRRSRQPAEEPTAP
ncbi:MAG: GGDEF domain-containing protein [Desulfovibrionaceae bacterium]